MLIRDYYGVRGRVVPGHAGGSIGWLPRHCQGRRSPTLNVLGGETILALGKECEIQPSSLMNWKFY